MNNNILSLIKVVNDNYSHCQDMETLSNLLRDGKYYDEGTEEEFVICRTTHNSHYNYGLFTSPEYQNPDNHVDAVMSRVAEKELNYITYNYKHNPPRHQHKL